MSTQDGKWWNQSWNPIHVKGGGWHCTKISPGCSQCWAEQINLRFRGSMINPPRFDNRQVEFELDQRILEQPLHWKKSRIVAVQWLGDLFHEQILFEFIARLFSVMAHSPQNTFLLLTKRPIRMNEFLGQVKNWEGWWTHNGSPPEKAYDGNGIIVGYGNKWPLPNVWLGVSICTQQEADEKIPILLQIPAAHRFVNLEPMLEGINIEKALCNCPWPEDAMRTRHLLSCPGDVRRPGILKRWPLDWALLGCESGPGRRPMELKWARDIAEQCKAARIPLWVKQIEVTKFKNPARPGMPERTKTKVSKDIHDWPEDLRIRQWPF
jgi:protein gp37